MAAGGVPEDSKKARELGATLVFLDESGFLVSPTVRRTFAPRGKTPILASWGRRHGKISAISAITVSPRRRRFGLRFRLLPDNENVRGPDVVSFLQRLHRVFRRLVVVWDRSNTHDKSTVVRAYLAEHPDILTERFPGYAPDLNPDEQVWRHTKWGRLHNFVPSSLDELRGRVHGELRRLRGRRDLLASFVRHAHLRWAA